MGFKPAGGIRTAQESLVWLTLIKEELGSDWLCPGLFRLGASSLLADIERQVRTGAVSGHVLLVAFTFASSCTDLSSGDPTVCSLPWPAHGLSCFLFIDQSEPEDLDTSLNQPIHADLMHQCDMWWRTELNAQWRFKFYILIDYSSQNKMFVPDSFIYSCKWW